MKETKNRVNEQIRAQELRLIDNDGVHLGVVTLNKALSIAQELSMDLVEIQSNSIPPVARLMDYGKFLFKQSKQIALSKKKQVRVKVKEVKFRPNTDINDYKVKIRNLSSFLTSGNKAKIVVVFRGRELSYQDIGMKLLDRIYNDLKDISFIEFYPKLEGKQLVMMVSPNKK